MTDVFDVLAGAHAEAKQMLADLERARPAAAGHRGPVAAPQEDGRAARHRKGAPDCRPPRQPTMVCSPS